MSMTTEYIRLQRRLTPKKARKKAKLKGTFFSWGEFGEKVRMALDLALDRRLKNLL